MLSGECTRCVVRSLAEARVQQLAQRPAEGGVQLSCSREEPEQRRQHEWSERQVGDEGARQVGAAPEQHATRDHKLVKHWVYL